ncbi:MAG: VWA domain-containing protein [Bdellovibrionaceae bacterium]|nr:VWA domain-containing protein [Pseudobdellovibrionaceae bacterium]
MKLKLTTLILLSSILSACSDVEFNNVATRSLNDNNHPNIDNPISELSLVHHTVKLSKQENIESIDILLIIDNSGSMETEHRNLSDRFSTLIDSIQNLDWRICITTTDYQNDDGRLYSFSDGKKWINVGDPRAEEKFLQVISDISNQTQAGSGDERGIYAINRALQKNEGCFRNGANLSTIVLSDENEASNLEDLVNLDFPEVALNTLGQLYPEKLAKYTHHSLVIKSDDYDCLDQQAQQLFNGKNVKAYFGTFYEELSEKTGGLVGSVCSQDYGSQLKLIGTIITANTLGKVQLQCVPMNDEGKIISSPELLIYDPLQRPLVNSTQKELLASFQIKDKNTSYLELEIVYFCPK